MAISVAALTTVVMSTVDENLAGVASGTNNAVSRIAGLFAVAIFGLLLGTIFNHSLDRRLESLGVPSPIRAQVDAQRSRLAAAETTDPGGRQAIAESFVDGFRAVLWAAALLGVASAVTAGILIDSAGPKDNGADVRRELTEL